MKLNLPFIKSRGWECGQACSAMIIKYLQPNFTPDFNEMNEVIHHKKGMYTFPPQLGILLDHYGVTGHVCSCVDIKKVDADPISLIQCAWGHSAIAQDYSVVKL